MNKKQFTPKYKVGEYVIHGVTRVKILAYTPCGEYIEYIIEHPVYGTMQMPEFILRPYPGLKYQEGEEVYYKDGTKQIISAIGDPYSPCPYYIGTIRVSEKELLPSDMTLEEFKSRFNKAMKDQVTTEVLKLCFLYPDRAQEYYKTLA